MDPFSISTGVAGFLSLALELGKILSNYTSQVNSAPKDAHDLLTEITALSHTLKQLITFLTEQDVKGNFHQTSALCIVIEICKSKIERLHPKLVKFRVSGGFSDRLKWPFKREECVEIVQTLYRCTQTIEFSLTIANCELLSKTSGEVMTGLSQQKQQIDSVMSLFPVIPDQMSKMSTTLGEVLGFVSTLDQLAIDMQQIKLGVQNLQLNMDVENTEKLLAWLSPLEPQKRHQDVKSSRLKNTGTWILQTDQFKSWLSSSIERPSERILGCYGMPGAGKTVIASVVIDHLSLEVEPPRAAIVYIYCDYRDQKDQVPLHLVGSLVKQLVLRLSSSSQPLPEMITKKFESARESRASLQLDDARAMLNDLLQKLDITFICIDAMDELEDQTRIEFLTLIKDSLHMERSSSETQSNSMVRLLFTGRPNVKDQVCRVLGRQLESLEIVAKDDDIRRYLTHKIDSDPSPDAMNSKLKDEVLQVLLEKSQGMFLLPALHINMILQKPTIRKRRDALHNLPTGLYAAYEITISRIQQSARRAELGMKVLMWICLAERPLNVIELRHALAVEDEDAALDEENIPSEKTLLDCCYGLVVIDDESSTVRLVHYTLQEYFKLHYEKHFPIGHNSLAKACLTYLNFSPLACPCGSATELNQLKADFPLLNYASCQWGHHARKRYNGSVEALATKLLQLHHPAGVQELSRFLNSDRSYHLGIYGGRWDSTFCGIHAVAYFGVEGILQVLPHAPNLNSTAQGRGGVSPLVYAIWYFRNEAVVRLLLERADIEADAQDKEGRTPLSYHM